MYLLLCLDVDAASSTPKRRTNVTLKSLSCHHSAQSQTVSSHLSADGVQSPVGAQVSNRMLTDTTNTAD
jgi:hypothetical protein